MINIKDAEQAFLKLKNRDVSMYSPWTDVLRFGEELIAEIKRLQEWKDNHSCFAVVVRED